MHLAQIEETKARRIELESKLSAPQADRESISRALKELQASCKHPHATFERKVRGFEHHCPTCDLRWMSY